MILLLISFLAGVLTVLAPCTLPLLPVIIGSSVDSEKGSNRGKALTIALSLGVSVIIFTLLLKVSTLFITITQSVWAIISGVIIIIFGFISLFPNVWDRIPFISRLSVQSNKILGIGYKKKGFIGNVIIGASLGPVFSTCSPTYFVILATVLPTSLLLGTIYLIAYALGLAGSLLVIGYLGEKIIAKLGGISDTRGWFRRGLGLLFVLIGIFIVLGLDKKLETKLLNSNGFDVTKIEQKLLQLNSKGEKLTIAPEITRPSGFVNTNGKPITIGEFKDKKVVLLDIWTYSCINCQRTIPYLKAWDAKYKDYGLQIIGLHTPEFAFEKVEKNVETAVQGFGITYPVVLDNDYATWNAFGNQFWPRKYLIGGDGSIVYDHSGEGEYIETERAIQAALLKLQETTGTTFKIPTDLVDIKNDADMQKIGSPEIYFGASRNEYFANGRPGAEGDQTLTIPPVLQKNGLYLGGTWNFDGEYITNKTFAQVSMRYSAKNVYIVASSDLPEGIDVQVKKDGVFERTIHIKGNQLYTLIEGIDYSEHILELTIPNQGLNAFTFTFG